MLERGGVERVQEEPDCIQQIYHGSDEHHTAHKNVQLPSNIVWKFRTNTECSSQDWGQMNGPFSPLHINCIGYSFASVQRADNNLNQVSLSNSLAKGHLVQRKPAQVLTLASVQVLLLSTSS